MITGLVKTYGERENVPQYIECVVEHFKRSTDVRDTALKMFQHLEKYYPLDGLHPSTLAMTLVNLAAMEKYDSIATWEWSGENSCAYPTVLGHSKKLKAELEKSDDFPDLKNRKKNWQMKKNTSKF